MSSFFLEDVSSLLSWESLEFSAFGLLFSLHLIPTLVYNESPTQGNINSFIFAAYNHGRVFDSE